MRPGGSRRLGGVTMGTEAQQQAGVLADTVLEPTAATKDQFYECLEEPAIADGVAARQQSLWLT